MEYKEAKDIAVNICYKLQLHCDKINIAGSLRRKNPEVKDIEIIVVPKTEVVKVDLFDNTKEFRSLEFVRLAKMLGRVVKGDPSGKMMQIELPQKIMLDLFIPDDFDYYRQYAIRTGSREYSKKVIAGGWLRAGWCGSDKGFRKISDCTSYKTKAGVIEWKCINPLAEKPPVWQSEKEFFDFIQVRWKEPYKRNI